MMGSSNSAGCVDERSEAWRIALLSCNRFAYSKNSMIAIRVSIRSIKQASKPDQLTNWISAQQSALIAWKCIPDA